MAKPRVKIERLEARIPGDVKAILAKAASLQGRSLADFVVASAADAARRIIHQTEVLELTERDQIAFAEALLTPPEPPPALKKAVRRYQADGA